MDDNTEKQILAHLESIDRRLKRIEERLPCKPGDADMREKIALIEAQGNDILDLCRPSRIRRNKG